MYRRTVFLVWFVLVGAVNAAAPSTGFLDTLDVVARADREIAKKPVLAMAKLDGKMVAAGMRGAIMTSDKDGSLWHQSTGPVQSDLTALTFVGNVNGWAVGHDGIILHTRDGGETWLRQFDGRMAATQFKSYYNARIEAGRQDLQGLLKEVERNYQNGPVLPFLDVVFDDENHGFAVGPFGMVAGTDNGGETWLPRLEWAENPELYSYNAARKIGKEIFLAGEKGMVYRWDRSVQRFKRLPTGYSGSLFGIVGSDHILVGYGLQGTVVVSADAGQTWKVLRLPVPVTVVGADILPNGRVVLVTINGMLWLGDATASQFRPLTGGYGGIATGVMALSSNKIAISGLHGVVVQSLTVADAPRGLHAR